MSGQFAHRIAVVLAGVVLLCGACSTDHPVSRTGAAVVAEPLPDAPEALPITAQAEPPVDQPRGDGGLSLQGRFGLDMMYYRANDVDPYLTTTPVHPDDANFLTGATSAEPDDGSLGFAPLGGIYLTLGTDRVRLLGGVNGRWNLMHHAGYRQGIYATRQQVSDTRAPNDGSFVFTQVTPGVFSWIPAAGVETTIGKVILGAEVGFPYTQWEVRSGHDRFAEWETVQKESWEGFGIRYAGTISFKPYDGTTLFVSVAYETYDTDFGDVSGIGALLGGCVRW